MVSRVYDIETEDKNKDTPDGIKKGEVRKPTPFNPAFDRTALNSEYLHWGRMYYYETPDGITKWSENPFPHFTTRGLSKYLIDLTIRNTFLFEEARQTLASLGEKWDYGIRHYGKPLIDDPLGEAIPPTAPKGGGKGPMKGAL